MALRIFQTAFTAGELSPQLHARVDFAKYAQGAERLKNMICLPHGGASRRPGSYYIADAIDPEERSWLNRFIFSNEQAYVLEFAPFILRFFRDRAVVLGAGDGVELVTNGTFPADLTGWTETNTGTGDTTQTGGKARLTGGASGQTILWQQLATVVGQTYALTFDVDLTALAVQVGSSALLDDLLEATHCNPGRHGFAFEATTTTTVIQFSANLNFNSDLDNVSVQAADPLEVAHPYGATEIPELRFAQSADVIYITHQNHQPNKLLRLTQVEFELRPVNLAPPPTRELPQTLAATLTLAALTGSNIQADASASVFLAGDQHKILRIGGGRATVRTVDSATQIHVDIIDDFSDLGPHPAGRWTLTGSPSKDLDPDLKGPVGARITLTASGDSFRSTDVGKYIRDGAHGGFIRITEYTSATVVVGEVLVALESEDANPDAALAGNWTIEDPIWSDDRGWPGACCFHDQRLVMGGSPSEPLTFAASVTGDFENFYLGPDDDDGYDYELVGPYDVIRALVSQRSLIALTPGGEHIVSGGEGATPHITPTSVFAQTDTSYGCAFDPEPVHVGNAVLFVQRGTTRLRELTYDFGTDSRVAPDLSVLAEHLFQLGVVQIARHTAPDSYVLAVRADGALLCCAYERPEQVVAWSRWITGEAQDLTDGFYESVTVIPNACDTGDEIWAAVRRRLLVTEPAASITPSATTGTVTITASAAVFTADHEGYTITNKDGDGIVVIDTFNSTTEVVGHTTEDFDSTDALASGEWDLSLVRRFIEVFDYRLNTDAAVTYTGTAVGSLTGLDHLEGETVTVVADGEDSTQAVTSGAITVDPAESIEAGIIYNSRIRTLRPEYSSGAGLTLTRIRRVVDASVRFYCCGPGWKINGVETDVEGDETRRDHKGADTGFLEFVQDRRVPNLGWDKVGRITVEQLRPFKGTVLAIGGRVELEDEG